MTRIFSALIGTSVAAILNAFWLIGIAYIDEKIQPSSGVWSPLGTIVYGIYGFFWGMIAGAVIGAFRLKVYEAATVGAGLGLLSVVPVFLLINWNVGYSDSVREQIAKAEQLRLIIGGTFLFGGAVVSGVTSTILNLIFGARSTEVLK